MHRQDCWAAFSFEPDSITKENIKWRKKGKGNRDREQSGEVRDGKVMKTSLKVEECRTHTDTKEKREKGRERKRGGEGEIEG